MSTAVPIITDHAARALAALPTQLRNQPILAALITALAEEGQEVEQMFADLCLLRQLEDCTGANLDGWGQIVGCLRAGRTDANYRIAIYAQIYMNNSCGEPNRVIEAAKIITGATDVLYNPVPTPPGYGLDITGATVEPANMQEIMEAISPVGVPVEIVFVP